MNFRYTNLWKKTLDTDYFPWFVIALYTIPKLGFTLSLCGLCFSFCDNTIGTHPEE